VQEETHLREVDRLAVSYIHVFLQVYNIGVYYFYMVYMVG